MENRTRISNATEDVRAKHVGAFYELESSLPAAALKPGKKKTHVHRTIHLTGPKESFAAVPQAVLGQPLQAIKTALKAKRSTHTAAYFSDTIY